MNEDKITVEQKAHDLAVAYAVYSSSRHEEQLDAEPFYQEYENAYVALLPIVKRYS